MGLPQNPRREDDMGKSFSLDDQIRYLERTITHRKQANDRFVRNGYIDAKQAEEEILFLRAMLDSLRRLKRIEMNNMAH